MLPFGPLHRCRCFSYQDGAWLCGQGGEVSGHANSQMLHLWCFAVTFLVYSMFHAMTGKAFLGSIDVLGSNQSRAHYLEA